MTAFDRTLLPNVPDELRTSCRHDQPLTDDFYATVSCRPGEPVSSLTYSQAKSGFLLFDHFLSSVAAAGLSDAQPLALSGLCSTGLIPSVNSTAPHGLSGRSEVPAELARDERLGYILCYKQGNRHRIEWTTSEIGVHAVATGLAGDELEPLYEWWSRDAGPEP